jgi:peroxiredoxin
MTIEVGQMAPDFTLPNQDREPTTLSELRGKPVVLVFYPFDFSPPCTAEHCEIRDEHKDWVERGATILGISRDSHFVHKAFKDAQHLDYPLLADMKGEVARLYGTWNEDVGVANRLTVVIDADGKIVHTTSSESLPELPDHSGVLAHLG